MPFGIPTHEAAERELADGGGANLDDLTRVANAAVDEVLVGLAASKKDLAAVRAALVRSLTAAAASNRADLALVQEALGRELTLGASVNAGDMVALPPGVAADCRRRGHCSLTQVLWVPDSVTPPAAVVLRLILDEPAPAGGYPVQVSGGPCTGTPPGGDDFLLQFGEQLILVPAGATVRDVAFTVPAGTGVGRCEPTVTDGLTGAIFVPTLTILAGGAGSCPPGQVLVPGVNGGPPVCVPAPPPLELPPVPPTDGVAGGFLVDVYACNGTHVCRAAGTAPPPGGVLISALTTVFQARLQFPGCDLAQCGAGAAANGAPPPPAPPPAPPPDLNCPQLPASLRGGFPLPGTPEFCELTGDIISFFEELGGALIDWLVNVTDPARLVGYLDGYRTRGSLSNVGGYVIDALVAVLKLALTTAAEFIRWLASVVKCVYRLVLAILPKCNVLGLTAVMVTQSIMASLKDIQVGTDAAVWAVQRFTVEFPTLEVLLKRLEKYFCPLELPAIHEATEGWLRGYVSPQLRDCVWQLHGLNPKTFLDYAKARGEKLVTQEAIQYARRKGWDRATTEKFLQERSWVDEKELDARLYLYDELPTIQDHLLWLRKNVFDLEYLERYRLLDGFDTPEEVRQILGELAGGEGGAPGRPNFWARFGKDLRALGMPKSSAAYHFAAHWQMPSPEQMREMAFRLRPDRIGDILDGLLANRAIDQATHADMTANARPFTLSDLRRILTEQDYNVLARDWFTMISYRVPALTYLIGMFRQGVIGPDELQAYHRDLGYSELDSRRFVEVDDLQRLRMRADQGHGWTPGAIANAWAVRRMDVERVDELMARIGYTEAEAAELRERADVDFERPILTRARSKIVSQTTRQVAQAVAIGAFAPEQATQMLRDLGWPEEQASAVVTAEVQLGRLALMRQSIAAVRSSLHGGFVTSAQAGALLVQAGVQQWKIQDYLAAWGLQNGPARRARTAREIVNDVAEGAVAPAEALGRLLNLGYSDADSRLYLADAQRKVSSRAAAGRAAAAGDARRQAEQLRRLAYDARRQAKDLRAESVRMAPVGTLGRWAEKGIISESLYRERMASYGYDPASVQLHWAEVAAKRAKAAARPPAARPASP